MKIKITICHKVPSTKTGTDVRGCRFRQLRKSQITFVMGSAQLVDANG